MVKGKKKKNLLLHKMLRDIRENWKSFAAVFIICMLSSMLFLSIDGAWRGMEKNLEQQFSNNRLADIWIAGNISDRKARDIAALPGVADSQRRVHIRATADLKNEPNMDLYMNEGTARVSTAMVFEGEPLPDNKKNICILDNRFASAVELKLHDTFTVTVHGEKISLTVGGIGYNPEYIVYSDGFAFSAEPDSFGYAYLSPGTLGFLPYRETVVTLDKGADVNTVKQSIAKLLDDPSILIITRDDKMGMKMAIEEVDQIRALGQVFPSVFFLVAALITFSTMKRMVESQRLQIGTLCSLGYSKKELVRHYTGYGLLVSALGAVLGILGAHFVLGNIIMWVLKSIYNMPGASVYTHPAVMAAISAVTILIAMGASYLSCIKALKEVPAGLLRPKPPAHGKRIFLEYITPVWKRLSFSTKLIIRNMFRNTSRFFIGIVGVVGCSALLLTGFGMRDSVVYVLENHYTKTMRYDVRVDLDTAVSDQDYLQAIRLRAGANKQEAVMEGSCELFLDGQWVTKGLHVLENHHEAVYFQRNEKRVWLPAEGVALTERTAEETGLHVGNSVTVRAPNGRTAKAVVSDIISVQLGQGVYISKSAWRKLDIMPYSPTTLYLTGGDIRIDAIKDLDGVAKVRTIEKERTGNEAIVQVLNVVVLVMVIFAGALLLVVLFTLGQLNFFERMRDLATLMVLGFYPKETKHLILKENIAVAVIGLPLGLLAGPYLHWWVLTYGFPTMLEFIPYIAPSSWIFTPVLTILFAQIVNLLIGAKFKSVNMVEALKSVE